MPKVHFIVAFQFISYSFLHYIIVIRVYRVVVSCLFFILKHSLIHSRLFPIRVPITAIVHVVMYINIGILSFQYNSSLSVFRIFLDDYYTPVCLYFLRFSFIIQQLFYCLPLS